MVAVDIWNLTSRTARVNKEGVYLLPATQHILLRRTSNGGLEWWWLPSFSVWVKWDCFSKQGFNRVLFSSEEGTGWEDKSELDHSSEIIAACFLKELKQQFVIKFSIAQDTTPTVSCGKFVVRFQGEKS